MSDTALTPRGNSHPPEPRKPWHEEIVESLGKLASNFRTFRGSATIISTLTLACVLLGRTEWVMVFALVVIGVMVWAAFALKE